MRWRTKAQRSATLALLILALIALEGVATRSAMAQEDLWDQFITCRVKVRFEGNGPLIQPYLAAGAIIWQDSTEVDSIRVFRAMPVTIRHSMVLNRTGTMHEGPWIISYVTALNADQVADQIRASEHVAETEPVPEDMEELGEIAASEFPAAARIGFYDASQKYLHYWPPSAEKHPEDPSYWNTPELPEDTDLDLPQAWGITRGDSNVVVAIWDTGVWSNHDELEGQFVTPTDPPGDATPDSIDGHPCPGDCGVDDDGDGLVDEDAFNRLPSDTAEVWAWVVIDGDSLLVPENVPAIPVSGYSP